MAGGPSTEEFDRFFEDVKSRLVGQAFLLTSDVEEAKDLAQEALLRAWRAWARVSQLDDPEAWVRRVLHNLAIGRWRRRLVERRHAPFQPAPTAPAAEIDALVVAEALQALPHRQRQVLVLRAVVGLSTAEIAGEVGTTEATVRMWLSRARTQLRASLTAEDTAASKEQER